MAAPLTQSQVVTTYEIFVTSFNSQQHAVGQILSINPSEGRTITDSFVLGNNPPDVPFELIPGPVTTRQLVARRVALFVSEFQKALARDDQDVVVSLSDQNTPFTIVETVTNPNTGQTKTKTYVGCYIERYIATRDIGAAADIREIQECTIRYLTVSGTDFQ